MIPALAIYQQNECSKVYTKIKRISSKNQPEASDIRDDPTISAKSQQLTFLQRAPKERSSEKSSEEGKTPETPENIQKSVHRSILIVKTHRTEKSNTSLNELQSSDDSQIDECHIVIDNSSTNRCVKLLFHVAATG